MTRSVFCIVGYVERLQKIQISFFTTIPSHAALWSITGEYSPPNHPYTRLYSLFPYRPVLRTNYSILARITPEGLRAHRQTHVFRAPCCFCASLEPFGHDYMETCVYVATEGEYLGEYVAECALKHCGYIGMYYDLSQALIVPCLSFL